MCAGWVLSSNGDMVECWPAVETWVCACLLLTSNGDMVVCFLADELIADVYQSEGALKGLFCYWAWNLWLGMTKLFSSSFGEGVPAP